MGRNRNKVRNFIVGVETNTMIPPRQHIADLAEICRIKEVSGVVISPGSRSAPLIQAFLSVFGDQCVSIVDERSAAYFALGMAQHLRKPIVLLCTSGTAVLNYAPALAEAYYQKVPLLAITADRPREWIDQQDNQTLRQPGIFSHFIKAGYDLPQAIHSEDDLWYAHRITNEAIDLCQAFEMGPVHVNVPLTEPLYTPLPAATHPLRIVQSEKIDTDIRLSENLVQDWNRAQRILVVHGQDHPDSGIAPWLNQLSADERVAIMAENISNVQGPHIISYSNLLLSKHREHSPPAPDLVLHSGGQVVSKALAGYLRRITGAKCWRIGQGYPLIDTFRMATCSIPHPPNEVYRALLKHRSSEESSYRDIWHHAASKAQASLQKDMRYAPFSDLYVFKRIMPLIPAGMQVFLGNSSIIRYAQLFPVLQSMSFFANRGVSGIDGCLSSAAGIAYASGKNTLVFTGDLGFLYDSNALWNRDLPSHLKIILINNGGGGMFHILKGPSEQPGFKKFVEAHHPVDIQSLVKAFGLQYYSADDEESLDLQWPKFIREETCASVLEIKTNPLVSAEVFRALLSIT
jgi:2-succinyl-5-enolpyruvyl-6-hydroxy-3-cyclohexene-1-carboxylate synthase